MTSAAAALCMGTDVPSDHWSTTTMYVASDSGAGAALRARAISSPSVIKYWASGAIRAQGVVDSCACATQIRLSAVAKRKTVIERLANTFPFMLLFPEQSRPPRGSGSLNIEKLIRREKQLATFDD